MASWTQPPAVLWPDADNDHDASSSGGIGYIAATSTSPTINSRPQFHPCRSPGTGANYIYYDTSGGHDSARRSAACANGLGAAGALYE